MSDHHYCLLLPDADQSELEALHQKALDWLVSAGIVERELTHCLLGMDQLGHAPAPGFMQASSEPEDLTCTNMNYAGFMTSKVNGLGIESGRKIQPDNEGTFSGADCPNCGERRELFDQPWNAAATEWLEWRGPGNLNCERCGATHGIADWRNDSLGFGALSFTFWNWPPLSEAFVRDLSQVLRQRIVSFTGSV